MIKIPTVILDKFEQATDSIDYGSVSLTLTIKQGKSRYVISKEESFLATDELSVEMEKNDFSKIT